MAFTPPIPTTPLAVEVRPNHWRKLGPKDFSRGLKEDGTPSAFDIRGWSAIDDRGETELTIDRQPSGSFTWRIRRLTDGAELFCARCRRG